MNDRKPNIFARLGARIARFFRETKSELKKVVWPTRKQLVNNTIIVLVALVIVSVVIFGFDSLSSFFVVRVLIGMIGGK